jgi:hypothetical protein
MMKNIVIILITGFGFMVAMEQPQPRILYKQPKSLKELAYLKSVQNIKSVADFNKLIAVTPVDLHCDLVKKVIHNKKLTQKEIMQLINQHCKANVLLKAYTYYTRISPENRKQNLMSMHVLKEAALVQQDLNGAQLISEFITQAVSPENNFTLLKALINRNDIGLIQQVISLGEQPTIRDLANSIALNRNEIIEILINTGMPLQDDKLYITEQPLHIAFLRLNETVVATLIAHGVSLTQEYLITTGSTERDTIANDIRIRIKNWNTNQPLPGQTVEQTKEYFEKVTALLNKYAPQKPEARRKSF